MSTRATWFELKTPTAVFDVHEDYLAGCHEPDKPSLLVYCQLTHDERGNEYGAGRLDDGGACGIFYVSANDFEKLCVRYLQHRGKLPRDEPKAGER